MSAVAAVDLSTLYETDETAWLEAMAALIARGELAELDYAHLAEYLTDMAIRDRREVESRLRVLLAHLLKWRFQTERRSGGWRATILVQQRDLRALAGRGVLRQHAATVLPDAYVDAIDFAAAETGLPKTQFPAQCPYTLETLLAGDLLAD